MQARFNRRALTGAAQQALRSRRHPGTPLARSILFASATLFSCLSSQVFCFVVSAVVNAAAFLRWRKWSDAEKRRSWPHYGCFTALCSVGSAAGALAFVTRVAQLTQNYPSRRMQMQLQNPTPDEYIRICEMRGYEVRFTAAHFVLFPIELGCVLVAKLLVLHRLHVFALNKSARPQLWLRASKLLLIAVVVGSVVGFCANAASAAFFSQASDFARLAADAFASNNSVAGNVNLQMVNSKASSAIRVSSVQRFCEVAVLLITIVAFLVVGVTSHRIIASALRTLLNALRRLDKHAPASTTSASSIQSSALLVAQASLQGKALQRKVLGATAPFAHDVFVTL